MKCPSCSEIKNRVTDSRTSKDGTIIRRRRECEECQHRFTTYEKVEEFIPLIVKKDGRRESFDREKLLEGLRTACEKRPISIEILEGLVDKIESELSERGEKEISSRDVGEKVMRELQRLDQVAYVRFASVYRSFKDINEFMNELKGMLASEK